MSDENLLDLLSNQFDSRIVFPDKLSKMAHDRIVELQAKVKELETKLNYTVDLIGRWCADIESNGTGWDDWDRNYKEARYEDRKQENPCHSEISASTMKHLETQRGW